MERRERELLSRLKIILPGEYGFTFDGRTAIGTFAVGGGQRGCRGYLIFDEQNRWAGLAYVDFEDLDLFSVEEMIGLMRSRGSIDFSLGLTQNSSLDPSFFDFKRVIFLNGSEFYYDPVSNQIIYKVPQNAKKVLYERLPILNQRLRSSDKHLIMV